MNTSALVSAVLLLTAALASDAAPTSGDPLKTDAGWLAGTMMGDVRSTVRVYRGIPYAAPPVGNLRWREPQPVTPWQGIREATQYGKMCPQSFPASRVSDSVQESGMSEDCLYLNVVTPAQSGQAKLPVMVWFHGGGLTTGWGNSDSSNNRFLPQKGVVQVSVTHRLGPMGYFAHPALSAESAQRVSGNYGSLDTLAALQWVQKNIAIFGGDPANVTIFGVSGGGQKVLWLMASPLATGLFSRAIVMSGGIGGTPLQQTEQFGVKLAAAVGITDGPDALNALRTKPWQELIKAANDENNGYRAVFTIDNWSMKGVEAQSDVPLMVGFMGAEKAPERSPAFIARAITPATRNLTTRYAYVFTHIPYGWGSKGGLAYHGGDVAYAFAVPWEIKDHYGSLYRPEATSGIPRDPQLDQRDDWVAEAMSSMVVQFAKTGNPNLDQATLKKLGKTWTWPKLDQQDLYLDIGVTPIV
jgi:para-nitrobenzyl esterase